MATKSFVDSKPVTVFSNTAARLAGNGDVARRQPRQASRLLQALMLSAFVSLAACSSEAPEMAAPPDDTAPSSDVAEPGGASPEKDAGSGSAALEEKAEGNERARPVARPAPAKVEKLETKDLPIGGTRGVTIKKRADSETAPASPGAGSNPAEVNEAPTVAAAAEADKDWTVVPVYYGTDRARKDQPKRIDYGWERGRRLELGRALVTIPKEHEVPKVERPWAIKIPYTNITLYEAAEDPKRHFTIQEIEALTREQLLAYVKASLAESSRFKDHAVVFVHGYQTQFDSAVYRTAQITYDMDFDGAAFLYSWPSGGTLQGYTYDRESAAQAEIYLRQFLTMVAQETGAKTVSVIAHSMGNQLVLRVLQDLKRSLPEGLKLSQLILAAPDVDRDSFENIVSSITGVATGITLYAAANDQALQISRRVNGGVPRAGDVPAGGPLVVYGVDTIDATATSMDSLGINHSGYAENNALLNDIKQLIQTGLRPPEGRVPTLERITTDRGDYWRYPAAKP